MQKPENYDSEKAATFGGGFDMVPEGAYQFHILRFEELFTKDHKPQILLKVDISFGNHTQTFKELSVDKNKDMLLRIYQCTTGESTKWFKGLITCIENANTPYKFDFANPSLIVSKVFYAWLGRKKTEKGEWYDISGFRSQIEDVKAPKQKQKNTSVNASTQSKVSDSVEPMPWEV